MNQRLSRNDDKKNNMDFMSVNTGGHIARHTPNEDPQVQVPQKVTGESKPEVQQGAAKASPNFKSITPSAKAMDKKDEQKVIAENSTNVQGDDKKSDATE